MAKQRKLSERDADREAGKGVKRDKEEGKSLCGAAGLGGMAGWRVRADVSVGLL